MNVKIALCAGLVAGVFIFGAGWTVQGWRRDAEVTRIKADADRQAAQAAEMASATEREFRRAFDTISMNSRKERDLAKASIDSLRADLRSGHERLSVAVASCPAGNTSAGNSEARADLLPATAERILDIAADADDTVRDLNECIDKYESVKRIVEESPQ